MQHIEEDLIEQYAMGVLPEESIAQLEEHLLICSVCQTRLLEADEFLKIFRSAATPADMRLSPRWISPFNFRAWLWPGALASLTALLIVMSTGDSHLTKLAPSTLLLHSLRGPETAASMASGRPCLLEFDFAVSADVGDFDISIVNSIGNEVLRQAAELKSGHLFLLVDSLVPGSYWARVIRRERSRELLAEYGLRVE